MKISLSIPAFATRELKREKANEDLIRLAAGKTDEVLRLLYP